MIPFYRSFTELMLITNSKNQKTYNFNSDQNKGFSNDSKKVKINIESNGQKLIELPKLPKIERKKWIKTREAVSKFFDELDYRDEIQSSYELTLLERQKDYDNQNVA